MSDLLVAPLTINVLVQNSDMTVVGPMADFYQLPYSGKGQDFNSSTANVSEEILSKPFQNRNFQLRPGIHLHWLLPAMLTAEIPASLRQEGKVNYPSVPNRWLVVKSAAQADHSYVVVKKWVVESDYLYPADLSHQPPAVSIPWPAGKAAEPPYRFLGKYDELEFWEPKDSHDYLKPFTAIGYGTPAFSAFYPNCHSVFGCYDPEVSFSEKNNYRYEVFGVYSTGSDDYLLQLIDRIKAQPQEKGEERKPNQIIQDQLQHWFRVTYDSAGLVPQQLVCYGQITVDTSNPNPPPALATEETVAVVIGNTGTEALSAFLGQKLHPDSPYKIEDQLEAIQFAGKLENRQADVGPKFQEARHEKEFTASNGGLVWTIRPDLPDVNSAPGASDTQLTLPQPLAHQLNALNAIQQAYDQAHFELHSMREQLFGDWYKYMVNTYPPEDTADSYYDVDEVLYFVRHKSASQLAKLESRTGQYKVVKANHQQSVKRADAGASGPGSLAQTLAAAINQLVEATENYNLSITRLQVADIQDGKAFILAFNRGAGLAGGLKKIFETLPAAVQEILKQTAPDAAGTDDQKGQLVSALNELLGRNAFFSAQDLVAASPSTPIQTLEAVPAEQRTAAQIARLNRLYLSALLPGIILPGSKSWVGLQSVPADRFWQPTEPVVLLAGEATRSTGLADPEAPLRCLLLRDMPGSYSGKLNKTVLEDFLNNIRRAGGDQLPKTNGETPPWNPFLLEWEIELFPVAEGSNHQNQYSAYQPGYIQKNYGLPPDFCDLRIRPNCGEVIKGANLYAGTSLLMPGAAKVQKKAIDAFLKKQLLLGTLTDPRSGDKDKQVPLSQSEIARIQSDYEQKNFTEETLESQKAVDAVYTAIRAYALLVADDFHVISQALSGFNAALRMKKQTFQLTISDPVGFTDYQDFTEQEVRPLVGNYNRYAPQPLFGFNPIRTGELNISQLSLVDTFGRVKDLRPKVLHASHQLHQANSQFPVALPPRLAQEARLNFRWLSADPEHGDMEMNAHPATSPVCGWMVPNNLDQSLAFYDAAGALLGFLLTIPAYQDELLARWDRAPGGGGVASLGEIVNPHLQKVICRIQQKGPEFVDRFLAAVDSAQENMAPDSFAQHPGLALLMGRPLAIVRASLQFQLKGRPAIDESWDAFLEDMTRQERETNRFEQVNFPIRIGEYQQLNDGVVGYWLERKGEIPREEPFFAPQSEAVTLDQMHPQIVYHAHGAEILSASLAEEPLTLSLVVDPRAAVHATTGILPTQVLTIPPDQYTRALEKICITFLTAPLLTPADKLQVSLPGEPGYEWSWVERNKNEWRQVGTTGMLSQPQLLQAFDQDALLWDQLVAAGWLKMTGEDRASVVARDQRTAARLDARYDPLLPAIERFLDQTQLTAMVATANFQGLQSIREGWLKLQPKDNPIDKQS
jgi:hypothetical protein